MSATEFRLQFADAIATESWAAKLAVICKRGDCITLAGPLGAGKTTFARGFIRALACEVEVTSPTFTLLNIYGSTLPLYHADLYRLKSAAELAELGLEEAEAGIMLVEWPEIAANALPKGHLPLVLSIPEGHPQTRILVGNPPVRWYDRLKEAGLLE